MKRSLGSVWKIGLWSVYQKSNNYLTIQPLARHISHRFWWMLNGGLLTRMKKKWQKCWRWIRIPPALHFMSRRTRSSDRANESFENVSEQNAKKMVKGFKSWNACGILMENGQIRSRLDKNETKNGPKIDRKWTKSGDWKRHVGYRTLHSRRTYTYVFAFDHLGVLDRAK